MTENWLCLYQCWGFGYAWIRIKVKSRIWIRIKEITWTSLQIEYETICAIFKILSLYLEARILIWVRIKVMQIRNTGLYIVAIIKRFSFTGRNGKEPWYSRLAGGDTTADHSLLWSQSSQWNFASEGCLSQIPLCLHLLQCLEKSPLQQADPPPHFHILPPPHEECHHRPFSQIIWQFKLQTLARKPLPRVFCGIGRSVP